MELTKQVFLYLSLAAVGCMGIGLFRPWVMLWWEDIQNRKKVIQLYGTVALVTFAIHTILSLI